MKKIFLLFGILITALMLSGCKGFVVYDEYSDEFKNKPESDFSYLKDL